MDSVFFVFEIIGVVAFSLSGAMLALKCGMDIFGVCVLGLTTAVGGGIIRDILLGITPPTSLVNPVYALIAIAVSAFTFLPFMQKFLCHTHKAYNRLLLLADSIGLGIFTVIGVNACFVKGYQQVFMCVILGVITGVGGGVMRDVMSKNMPYIFVKHFYACASIIGALSCALLFNICGRLISMLVGMTVIIILRFLAAKFHWELPKPSAFK